MNDEQKAVYPHNDMLFGNKKKWHTATWYNMDENIMLIEKKIREGHISYDSTYMKHPEKTNL